MKSQMRGVSNEVWEELRGKHSGTRIWKSRWIKRFHWFLQRRYWVWIPIGIGVIIKDSTPGKRFVNLNTGGLKIVKVNISSQSKESWNLGIEAMELEEKSLAMEGGSNQ